MLKFARRSHGERKHSFLYNLIWSRWQIVKLGGSHLDRYRQLLARNFEPSSPGWQMSRRCLGELALLTRSNSIRLIVIPFPVLGGLSQKPYLFEKYVRTVCEAALAERAQ